MIKKSTFIQPALEVCLSPCFGKIISPSQFFYVIDKEPIEVDRQKPNPQTIKTGLLESMYSQPVSNLSHL